MNLKKEAERYVLYNLLTIPIIFAVYAPYMLLWIQLTTPQFIRWFVGGLPWALLANLIIAPSFRRVIRFIDRIIT